MIISLVMPAPGGPSDRRRHLGPLLAAPHGGEKTREQRQGAAQRERWEAIGHFEEPCLRWPPVRGLRSPVADRRLQTVDRGPLVREATHPDVENQAEPRQRGDHGGAAVTHER